MKISTKDKIIKNKKAFTLVELLVTISIFVIISILVLADYRGFNKGILFTNISYEIGLLIREAQVYGLSNQNEDESSIQDYGYGIHFDTLKNSDPNLGEINKIILFKDKLKNRQEDRNLRTGSLFFESEDSVFVEDESGGGDIIKNDGILKIKKPYSIAGYYINDDTTSFKTGKLDIIFVRPNPSAIMTYIDNSKTIVNKAIIVIRLDKGDTEGIRDKCIAVFKTGQISVGTLNESKECKN